VELTTDQRILEASMALPAYGGVTGWAGLRWAGGAWFGGLGVGGLPRPVTLAAGPAIRAQPGIAVSAERLDPLLLTLVDGVRITIPVRSVDFEMRYAEGLWAAVEVLDMAAYSDLVSIDEMWRYALAHSGWTGIGQERHAIALADENSWSPEETWTRLVWVVVAELPPLVLCNRPLFDRRGNFIGTPDLIDEEAGLIIEYEGTVHLDKARRGSDVKREAQFRGHGLEYMAVVGADHASSSALAARMHEARSRARFAAPSVRDWTLDTPHWWRPTHSVQLRRGIPPAERRRLLGYRAA
jgi:hypothetical protein